MYEDFENEDYLNYKPDLKDFTQRFLFLEYLEEWEQARFKNQYTESLEHMIWVDLQLHIEDENYPTAQLYQDVIERYKIDLTEFE